MAQAIRTAIRSVGLAAVIAGLSSAAVAATLQAAVAAARSARHLGVPAFAGLSETHQASHLWSVTSFYVRWRAEGDPREGRRSPVWAAQRTSARADGDAKVEWLSSESCPALAARLARLKGLQPPVLQVPGLEPRSDTIPVTQEGVDYRLWTRFARYPNAGDVGDLEISGKPPSPLALWADETQKALAGCWRDAEPGP